MVPGENNLYHPRLFTIQTFLKDSLEPRAISAMIGSNTEIQEICGELYPKNPERKPFLHLHISQQQKNKTNVLYNQHFHMLILKV